MVHSSGVVGSVIETIMSQALQKMWPFWERSWKKTPPLQTFWGGGCMPNLSDVSVQERFPSAAKSCAVRSSEVRKCENGRLLSPTSDA